MKYIKTLNSDGSVSSIQSISDDSGAPDGVIPTVVLGKNQSFITQVEFNALISQIRGDK